MMRTSAPCSDELLRNDLNRWRKNKSRHPEVAASFQLAWNAQALAPLFKRANET